MTDTPAIGHNNPPEPTPFEAMQAHVLDLMETSQGFLDGEPVTTEGMAAEVAKLIDAARKAQKDADRLRKEEAKPFDDGKKAVQEKWTPLSDANIGKCAMIIATAKRALVPYQLELQRQQEEAAKLARQAAETARQAAIEAERAATASADLEAVARAETLRREAAKADITANKAAKATPAIAVEGGRAIGLRPYWKAELVDPVAALKHYKAAQPDALKAWLLDQAQKDVHAGVRSIPGFDVIDEKRAA